MLESRGIDPRPIYAVGGLDAEALHGERNRINSAQMDRVWAQIDRVVDDACFALDLATFWRPGDFQSLDHAWLASPNLESALRILVRYFDIVDQSTALELVPCKRGLALQGKRNLGGFKDYPALNTAFFALIVRMSRLLAGEKLAPRQLTLRHADDSCAAQYQAWFRCPVHFSAAVDAVIFDETDLARSLSPNQEVAGALARILRQEQTRLRRNEGITGQVHSLLVDALPAGRSDLKHLAESLALRPGELQERLRNAGTTYRAEVENARKGLATHYLQDKSLSLVEIAFLLGFSEQSAFSRACKRWFGKPPSALRS